MYKKILILLCLCFLITSLPISVFADNAEKEYNYNFKGLSINSNVKLDKQRLNLLFNDVTFQNNKNNQEEFLTYVVIPPDEYSGTIIEGPHNFQYDRGDVIEEMITLITSYFATKIPVNWLDNVWKNYLFTKFSGALSGIGEGNYVYYSTWLSKAWNDAWDVYFYYETIVYYEDANFTQPETVYYYEFGVAN